MSEPNLLQLDKKSLAAYAEQGPEQAQAVAQELLRRLLKRYATK